MGFFLSVYIGLRVEILHLYFLRHHLMRSLSTIHSRGEVQAKAACGIELYRADLGWVGWEHMCCGSHSLCQSEEHLGF